MQVVTSLPAVLVILMLFTANTTGREKSAAEKRRTKDYRKTEHKESLQVASTRTLHQDKVSTITKNKPPYSFIANRSTSTYSTEHVAEKTKSNFVDETSWIKVLNENLAEVKTLLRKCRQVEPKNLLKHADRRRQKNIAALDVKNWNLTSVHYVENSKGVPNVSLVQFKRLFELHSNVNTGQQNNVDFLESKSTEISHSTRFLKESGCSNFVNFLRSKWMKRRPLAKQQYLFKGSQMAKKKQVDYVNNENGDTSLRSTKSDSKKETKGLSSKLSFLQRWMKLDPEAEHDELDTLLRKGKQNQRNLSFSAKNESYSFIDIPHKYRIVKRNSDFFHHKKTTNTQNYTRPQGKRSTTSTPYNFAPKTPSTQLLATKPVYVKPKPSTLPTETNKPTTLGQDNRECSREKTCERRCTKTTERRTDVKFTCFCDPDCYEVFNDCCTDYIKYCGPQQSKNVTKKKFAWECVSSGNIDSRNETISDGVWMVTRCAADWPHDHIRQSCSDPKITTAFPDIYRAVPIVNRENITFRNVYCALCNNAADTYDSWTFNLATEVIPPRDFNLTEQIRFYLANNAEFQRFRPKLQHPRRYCIKNVITCQETKHAPCIKEAIQLVSISILPNKHYINKICAVCNGFKPSQLTCFPKYTVMEVTPPMSFSLVLNFRLFPSGEEAFELKEAKCANGLVFDEVLQVCTVKWIQPAEDGGPERYYVISWLKTNAKMEKPLPQEVVQQSFLEYFQLSLKTFNVNDLIEPKSTRRFYLVKSTLILTPEQSLKLRSRKSDKVSFNDSKLLNFIHFKTNWDLIFLNKTFTVFKTTSRPLKCFGRKMYTPLEYLVLDGGRIYVNATNSTYEKSQYFTDTATNDGRILGNITICEKYIPSACNLPWTVLLPGQFMIMENLSIYDNFTSRLYHYGQYDVLGNNSVQICISLSEGHTEQNKTINEALGWITLVCFLLSTLPLTILLTTYAIFPKLRTLPGKNLMNLATTLLITALLWLISSFSKPERYPKFCTAMLVVQHYFLIASFASMSVISFHTCKTFARQMPAPITSENHERKLIKRYMIIVWFFPAIFVGIFFLLDWKNTINLGYGDSQICWFRQKDGYIYLLTIPIVISMFFNILTFITAVLFLRKHSQNMAARENSSIKRSNLLIYIKLSSLMGFTWLFGLLTVVVSWSSIFEYLFVISTCLQGVFIGMAFVFKKETLKMYRELMSSSPSPSGLNSKTQRRDLQYT